MRFPELSSQPSLPSASHDISQSHPRGPLKPRPVIASQSRRARGPFFPRSVRVARHRSAVGGAALCGVCLPEEQNEGAGHAGAVTLGIGQEKFRALTPPTPEQASRVGDARDWFRMDTFRSSESIVPPPADREEGASPIGLRVEARAGRHPRIGWRGSRAVMAPWRRLAGVWSRLFEGSARTRDGLWESWSHGEVSAPPTSSFPVAAASAGHRRSLHCGCGPLAR